MPTISEQLTQLTQDRNDLVTNLTTQGITGLTGDETFTELVPEVLNIPPQTITNYVVAPYSEFTISQNNWASQQTQITINTGSYNVDASKFQIGLMPDSSAVNTANVVASGLSIASYSYSSPTYNLTINCVNVPSADVTIAIFGVSEISS